MILVDIFFNLAELKLNWGSTTEDVDRNGKTVLLVINLLNSTREVLEGTLGSTNLFTNFKEVLRTWSLRGLLQAI